MSKETNMLKLIKSWLVSPLYFNKACHSHRDCRENKPNPNFLELINSFGMFDEFTRNGYQGELINRKKKWREDNSITQIGPVGNSIFPSFFVDEGRLGLQKNVCSWAKNVFVTMMISMIRSILITILSSSTCVTMHILHGASSIGFESLLYCSTVYSIKLSNY